MWTFDISFKHESLQFRPKRRCEKNFLFITKILNSQIWCFSTFPILFCRRDPNHSRILVSKSRRLQLMWKFVNRDSIIHTLGSPNKRCEKNWNALEKNTNSPIFLPIDLASPELSAVSFVSSFSDSFGDSSGT